MSSSTRLPAVGFSLLLALVLEAETAFGAAVTVTVGNISAAAGGVAAVPINLTGASALRTFQMDLNFDPAVLQMKQVDNGPLLSANALLVPQIPRPGRLSITLVDQGGIQGDGTLCTIQFQVIGRPGSKSSLQIDSARAWFLPNQQGVPVALQTLAETKVNATGGELTVPAGIPWLWIAIAAAVVLLLLILFGATRRRSAAPAAGTMSAFNWTTLPEMQPCPAS